ncbi:MAG: hypothetical protein ACK5MF_17095 [Vibrio sp.]
MGCSTLSIQESAPEITIPSDITTVSLAIVDQRPYVVDQDKSPAFEGLIRSSLAIPYSYNTATGEPMSVFLTNRLEYGIQNKGLTVKRYDTNLTTSLPELLNSMKQDGNPSIVVLLHEWKYDYHPFSDNSWYDVDVIVNNKAGQKTVKKHYAGENDIPGGTIMNEMMLIYKSRFEEIFSDPELIQALEE